MRLVLRAYLAPWKPVALKARGFSADLRAAGSGALFSLAGAAGAGAVLALVAVPGAAAAAAASLKTNLPVLTAQFMGCDSDFCRSNLAAGACAAGAAALGACSFSALRTGRRPM